MLLETFKKIVENKLPNGIKVPMEYPPPIAQTLGFNLVEVGEGAAAIEMKTVMNRHANPMGTLHGGVMADIADAAIGTARATL